MASWKHSLSILSLTLLAATTASAVDPALLNLVMPDARAIAGIHIDQSKNSPFGRYLLSQVHEDTGDFQKFMTLTGFDPRRDLREVLVASTTGSKGRHLVAGRGAFDPARIIAAARLDGASVQNYMGVDVISGKQGDGWVAFLDASTAIGGDPESVRTAIAARRSSSALDAALRTRVNDLSSRYDAWMISLTPGASLTGHMPDPILKGEALQGISQVSGGVKFGSSVQINGEAVARSEKDAAALSDVVRFLTGMLQLNRDKPGAENIASLLDSLELRTSANTVTFSLAIPEPQLEKLLDSSKKPRAARKTAVI